MMRCAFITLLATLATTSACGSARRSDPLTGPLSLNAEQRHGQVLFHKFCHQCHPNGEAGLGPAINNKPAPLAMIRLQVRGGLGAMPAFPEKLLPDREIEALLTFVDAQRDQAR
jgi:mono/diheme cytochrome c family protein